MRVTTLLAVAAATLLAISPEQAATSALAVGKISVESSVTYTAAGKKKASASKSCGTFMYRKDGKCADARTKK